MCGGPSTLLRAFALHAGAGAALDALGEMARASADTEILVLRTYALYHEYGASRRWNAWWRNCAHGRWTWPRPWMTPCCGNCWDSWCA